MRGEHDAVTPRATVLDMRFALRREIKIHQINHSKRLLPVALSFLIQFLDVHFKLGPLFRAQNRAYALASL
jgi:hypothetical protein